MRLLGLAAAAAFVFTTSAFAALPLNKPVHLKNATVVCTGIGDQESNPAWNAYPLKIVVAGKLGQYLAGSDLRIAQGRQLLAAVRCDAPVILVKLSPGRYRLHAARLGATAATTAWVSNKGQGRAVLRFPHQGGTVSAAYLKSLREQALANPSPPHMAQAVHHRRAAQAKLHLAKAAKHRLAKAARHRVARTAIAHQVAYTRTKAGGD